ncbi:MAG: hypothetical protein JSV99_01880 [Planctomycetota bacterium]|nr:MAG: hypothetical protein JSV99_01880 [Planctomycetota bacterium]
MKKRSKGFPEKEGSLVCRPCIEWEGDEMILFRHEILDGTFFTLAKTIGRSGFGDCL